MATDNPRPEKVAIVEEIKGHLDASDAIVLTEYRGLDVPQQAELRAAVKNAGGQVKIYKNTLARRAADEAGLEIGDMLVGPTAIAFVGPDADGNPGDPVALAKALQDFADANDAFVVKGGLMDGAAVDPDGVKALSKLPSKEVMLGQLAGLLQSPMSKLASLLQAPLQNFAGLVKALEEKGGGSDAPAATEESSDDAAADDSAPADAADDASDSSEAPAEASADAEATEEEAPAEAPADAGEEATEDSGSDDAADEEGSDSAAEGE